MEYKKIERLVYTNNLIDRSLYNSKKEFDLKLDTMLIENLKKCIDKKIPLEMNENDFSKVYHIYIKLVKNNYDINKTFITDLANLSTKKLDYFEIIRDITE